MKCLLKKCLYATIFLLLQSALHLAAMDQAGGGIVPPPTSMATLIRNGNLDEFKTHNLAALSYEVIEELVNVANIKHTALTGVSQLDFSGETWNAFRAIITELEIIEEKYDFTTLPNITDPNEAQAAALQVIKQIKPFKSGVNYKTLMHVVKQTEAYAEKKRLEYYSNEYAEHISGLYKSYEKNYIEQELAKIKEIKIMLDKEYATATFTQNWFYNKEHGLGFIVEKTSS